MKIILYVDFANKDFNKDFELSNALIQDHTLLLVTNQKQLQSAISSYDIVLFGNSTNDNLQVENINHISIKGKTLNQVLTLLK